MQGPKTSEVPVAHKVAAADKHPNCPAILRVSQPPDLLTDTAVPETQKVHQRLKSQNEKKAHRHGKKHQENKLFR